jgi:2-polyprenyl-6-methoxyphenol hydroxylase-like FAD-dependent oxidoreductase
MILDQLVAIYSAAISKTMTDRDNRTFIESCADGWWYSALTPNGRRTVSFQTDADLLPGQQWRTREWFAERLGQTRHLSAMLQAHDYDFTEPPRLTSAHSGRLERFSGNGWLAVGDAAMSFDPLSGQGILKAMRSGMMAAEALVAGDQTAFCDFERLNESEWQQFATMRNEYYQLERQWGTEPFWERRKRAASSRE